MSREWKPGEVAHVDGDIYLRTGRGWVFASKGGEAWFHAEDDSADRVSYLVRPLVVIDPEDREAVERLQDLFADERDRNGGQSRLVVGGWADAMQAALREYANPRDPKPDEPQGLGAVVEDENGYLYVRGYVNGESTHEWHVIDPANNKRMGWWRYDEIDAVRVLSPGVVDQ